MMKRLQSGQWTLRDMREQFQGVLKMGPLGNIMNQFPGMAGLDFHDSGVRIKKWMTSARVFADRRGHRSSPALSLTAAFARSDGLDD